MLNFRLIRDEDVTGISGTGVVAEGTLFSNGAAVVAWLGEDASVVHWPKGMESVIRINGHGGKTRIVWEVGFVGEKAK